MDLMPSPRSSTRRDFLSGQAAADALADLVNQSGAAEALPAMPPAEDGYLVQVGRRAMACQFEAFFNAGQYPQATEVALQALDLVDELEAQMTVYRDSSEISHINRQAANEGVAVESRLFQLLRYALRAERRNQRRLRYHFGAIVESLGLLSPPGSAP